MYGRINNWAAFNLPASEERQIMRLSKDIDNTNRVINCLKDKVYKMSQEMAKMSQEMDQMSQEMAKMSQEIKDLKSLPYTV
jgi:peptidoglycan hydrolase CwlO-like protein